jgi:hypothetical protein
MVTDRKGKQISVGAHVIWYDPQEEFRDLTRVWQVDDVSEEIIYISDDYSEAEVLPSELEVVEKPKLDKTTVNKIIKSFTKTMKNHGHL